MRLAIEFLVFLAVAAALTWGASQGRSVGEGLAVAGTYVAAFLVGALYGHRKARVWGDA